jgi:YD repeat-containing protein
MGRPLAKRQYLKTGGTWSNPFPSNLTYDLAGNVTSQTCPAGSSRKVRCEYDSAGRLGSFTGTLGRSSTRTYSDQFSYWAGGQRKRECFGTTTNLYHNLHYNSRMQLVDIRFSSSSADEWNWNRGALITYYSATAAPNGNPFENNSDNNGNVIMATHYVPLNDAISSSYLGQRDYYTYNPLNRIQDVGEWQQNCAGTWSHPLYQKFVYDRWGNRTIDTVVSFGYANKAFTVTTSVNCGLTNPINSGQLDYRTTTYM